MTRRVPHSRRELPTRRLFATSPTASRAVVSSISTIPPVVSPGATLDAGEDVAMGLLRKVWPAARDEEER
jgi:hypothetical protein